MNFFKLFRYGFCKNALCIYRIPDPWCLQTLKWFFKQTKIKVKCWLYCWDIFSGWWRERYFYGLATLNYFFGYIVSHVKSIQAKVLYVFFIQSQLNLVFGGIMVWLFSNKKFQFYCFRILYWMPCLVQKDMLKRAYVMDTKTDSKCFPDIKKRKERIMY